MGGGGAEYSLMEMSEPLDDVSDRNDETTTTHAKEEEEGHFGVNDEELTGEVDMCVFWCYTDIYRHPSWCWLAPSWVLANSTIDVVHWNNLNLNFLFSTCQILSSCQARWWLFLLCPLTQQGYFCFPL